MKKYSIVLIIMLTWLISACANTNNPEEVVELATAVSTSTHTPQPTITAMPTETPTSEPTETSLPPTQAPTVEPTATATATPTPNRLIAFAFWNEESHAYQLGVMNTDGSERIEFAAPSRTLPEDYYPERLGYGVNFSWSPDGSRIAFAFMNDGITSPNSSNSGDKQFQMGIMNADGSNLVELSIPVDFNVYRAAPSYTWSPDGMQLALVSDGELYIVNADGTGLTLVESVAALKSQPDYNGVSSAFSPAWSPDKNHIAFVWDRNVMSLDLNDSTLTTITRPTPVPIEDNTTEFWGDPALAWSPDGAWIVNSQSGVYLYQHESPQEVIQISSWVGRNWNWSSDGMLLFGQVTDLDDDNFPTESLMFNMNDMTLVRNPALGMGDYLRGFSPDGSQMAFVSNRNGTYDLFVADADGAHINQLTNDEPFEGVFGWLPDGTGILFTWSQAGQQDIYMVAVDGAERVKLTDTAVNEFMAQLQPAP